MIIEDEVRVWGCTMWPFKSNSEFLLLIEVTMGFYRNVRFDGMRSVTVSDSCIWVNKLCKHYKRKCKINKGKGWIMLNFFWYLPPAIQNWKKSIRIFRKDFIYSGHFRAILVLLYLFAHQHTSRTPKTVYSMLNQFVLIVLFWSFISI